MVKVWEWTHLMSFKENCATQIYAELEATVLSSENEKKVQYWEWPLRNAARVWREKLQKKEKYHGSGFCFNKISDRALKPNYLMSPKANICNL